MTTNNRADSIGQRVTTGHTIYNRQTVSRQRVTTGHSKHSKFQ